MRDGDDDFVLGLSSGYLRIVVELSFDWRKELTDFYPKLVSDRDRSLAQYLVIMVELSVYLVFFGSKLELRVSWQAQNFGDVRG